MAERNEFDSVIQSIADYATGYKVESKEALDTARMGLMDSLGCAFLALEFPECKKLIGPVVPGALMDGGARVPGTSLELEPVQAAFCIGALIRWLDYNDTWLAAEWGHPSDNLGSILSVADYLSRQGKSVVVGDVLSTMIQAHEIQGVLALQNSFNRVGLDHVLLVRIASTAVSAKMLGANLDQIKNAVSNAWIDGGALRTYRHAPNTGSRKSWAAGDAASRGVRLALLALQGEMGYATALSAPTWGFQDVLYKGKEMNLERSLGTYVMENVLFKVTFPAEFHGQTAVEAAITLHPKVKDRLDDIQSIKIESQESAVRIIDKSGPLNNPADRDHCIQYMTAIGLIYGNLTAEHYSNKAAEDPRIDSLREKMEVVEKPEYSHDYLDPDKRSIGNAVQVFFKDKSSTENVSVEYPLGHRRRRDEAKPFLRNKFRDNMATQFAGDKVKAVLELFENPSKLDAMPVRDFMDLFVRD